MDQDEWSGKVECPQKSIFAQLLTHGLTTKKTRLLDMILNEEASNLYSVRIREKNSIKPIG